jgi:chromatin remodeling complex protein RSC6
MKPLQLSNEVAVVGSSPLPSPEVMSKVWEYINGHLLENPENKREVLANAKLRAILRGQEHGEHVRDEQAPRPSSLLR